MAAVVVRESSTMVDSNETPETWAVMDKGCITMSGGGTKVAVTSSGGGDRSKVVLRPKLNIMPLLSSHAARDTISQGQSITITETIVSAGAKFELGFFRPGNSTYQYVGIWFKKVSKQTVTWVANRNYQIVSSSAVLTISNDGNLVIMDGQLSYSVSNMPSNGNAKVSATLLDSGNLVLRDENSNILWQSFDFPSHTFLPGMKLEYKNNSGKSWSLVSWRNLHDPSPGVFSLELDHKGITQFITSRKPEGLYSNRLGWNPPSGGIYSGHNRKS
ncbi:G-type lectin S-receptor-like serine/threonine-protein kinase At2g19130 [Castanea sativa]|uniref:G-type lectin S-receptor-like serine/threonine-protein kinase At2g19130 n=1 Tax=Castanea sativa TaxID=21020 RepID=UPI003F651018